MKKLKIYVVDDEEEILDIFKYNFSQDKTHEIFEVEYVFNALDCIKKINDDHTKLPILILSDVHMRDMDGFEFLEAIKESHPEITMYLITGYSSDDFIVEAMDKGAGRIFTKPVNFEKLIELVRDDFKI